MATDELDELFGADDTPDPATTLPVVLAITGLLGAIAGLICCSIPGTALTLVGLWRVEIEHERIENGYYPSSAAPAVARARRIVFTCLLLGIGVLFVQANLYCGGFYQRLGDQIFLGEPTVTAPVPAAPPSPVTRPPAGSPTAPPAP